MVAKYILGILTLGFTLILLGNVSADYVYHLYNPYGTSMKTNSNAKITLNTDTYYTYSYDPYDYYMPVYNYTYVPTYNYTYYPYNNYAYVSSAYSHTTHHIYHYIQ